ncbi:MULTISPECIES: metallophosphoesterase family protein [unclassified Novosphingobium]|uniref:metallophosphoesterase family protein n=1 Tax=unclassified Novosphingobium TaxID=2644732 RepID=UPI0025E8CF6F|nr:MULTISPECIES: metallophosphoesterase family protein [unclassified Novosphingobium]HQV03534.1 metallophosphoesterase family protein [Novosphingobium sp.]
MLSKLRNLFGAAESAPPAAVPAGQRVYAVGDVHGRADLFAALSAAVDADDVARGNAETTVVLLGDLVDRGPDSAGVLRLARAWQERRPLRALMGNHEEMFLDALEKEDVLRHFLRYGGRETILSYPVDAQAYAEATLAQTQDLIRAALPAEDLSFMRGMEDMIRIGDYLFVHAGIRPGVPLEEQRVGDLRWIREPFTTARDNLGVTVVYGHTIYDDAELAPSRIGIDTGAYASGRLTALGLEGTSRWLIEAREEGGTVSVSQRSLS